MSSDRELETYAIILATLAQGQVDSSALLAQHGLDEQGWAALSARCEAALDEVDEGRDVSALERFSAAFAEAQAALSGGPATLEVWLSVLAALARGEALPVAIERAKLTLGQYLTTQAHWAARVQKDPELLARFRAALAGAQRR